MLRKALALLALCLAFAGTAAAQQTNQPMVITSSVAATTTYTSADLTNKLWKGGNIIIRFTGLSSGNFTPKVQGKDPASGQYYDIISGTAISGTGTTRLTVYPSAPHNNTTSVSDLLPFTWRIRLIGASTPVGTFTVGAQLAP